MLSRGPVWVLLFALLVNAGCAWSPPLRPDQVITQDAYRTADETIQRIADPFVPISAAELAARQHRSVRYPRGLALIDDTAAMREAAAGFSGSRKDLALELTDRLIATLAAPSARGGPPATTWIRLDVELFSALGGQGGELAVALTQLQSRLQPGERTALLIFSRADRVTEETVKTARRIQSHYGEWLCLHLVSIGDRTAFFGLRAFNTCGSAVRGEDIAAPATLAAYAIRLFYGDPPDSDGDGIEDYRDQCPGTPREVRVNWDGCPFDDAALKRLLPDELHTVW